MPGAQAAGAACFFSPRAVYTATASCSDSFTPFWISHCCLFIKGSGSVPALPSVPAISLCAPLPSGNGCRFIWTSLHLAMANCQVLFQLSWLRLPLGPGQPAATLPYLSWHLWGVLGDWHWCEGSLALLSAARQSLAAAS